MFYRELKHYAGARGYKAGWVAHKFRERFGYWPNGLEHLQPLNRAARRKTGLGRSRSPGRSRSRGGRSNGPTAATASTGSSMPARSRCWKARPFARPRCRAVSIMDRIAIELAHHGGNDNGKLPVTYNQFVEYGLHRHAIGPAIREGEALGLFFVTERGRANAGEFRSPSSYGSLPSGRQATRRPTSGSGSRPSRRPNSSLAPRGERNQFGLEHSGQFRPSREHASSRISVWIALKSSPGR